MNELTYLVLRSIYILRDKVFLPDIRECLKLKFFVDANYLEIDACVEILLFKNFISRSEEMRSLHGRGKEIQSYFRIEIAGEAFLKYGVHQTP